MLQHRRQLCEVGIASLTLSFLTIFPPLLVMTVVDRVLTHHSYSTLALLATMLVARLTEQLSIKISLKTFMGNPTVRAINSYLDQ